jgi:hypothetical protein
MEVVGLARLLAQTELKRQFQAGACLTLQMAEPVVEDGPLPLVALAELEVQEDQILHRELAAAVDQETVRSITTGM